MANINRYPYHDYNDLNLDWLIKTVKETVAEWASYHTTWEEWKNDTTAAFAALETYVHDYFDNLDLTEEMRAIINQMAANGTLKAMIYPWFEEWTAEIDAEMNALRAAVGGPLVASTVAEMTDHSKVYVYVGSETGYTAGDWYYWDGTAWTSGGVYQATALETDDTLTVAGMAADAKAAGDAIRAISTLFEPTPNLFNPAECVPGALYDGGTVGPNANYMTSDFIPVTDDSDYWFTAQTAVYCWYDSNKDFISGSYGYWSGVQGGHIMQSPADAAYCRVSYNILQDQPSTLSFYLYMGTGNLFDSLDLVDGVVYNNGNISPNANYKSTDYIRVYDTLTYHFTAQTAVWAFYGFDNAYIPGTYDFYSGVAGGQDISVPEGAAYIRLSFNVLQDDADDLDFSVIGSGVPPYVPYGLYMPYLTLTPEQQLHSYRQYEIGNQYFTVPVNTYVPHKGSNPYGYLDNEVMADVPAVIRLPANYSYYGRPVPLVLIFHGAGYGVTASAWGASQDEDENQASSFISGTINSLVAAGYAVADINSYNATFAQQHWGAPRAVYAYRKLYEYVTANYNVDPRVLIYGFSMGGLAALSYADLFRDSVRAVALGAPVTALYGQCWTGSYGPAHGWRQAVATAYDFDVTMVDEWTENPTPSAQEAACWTENLYLKYGFDPMEAIHDGANSKRWPPVRIWLGTADDAISLDATNAFVDSVRAAGGAISIRPVLGEGHNIAYGSNFYVTNEIIYWLNRFCAK